MGIGLSSFAFWHIILFLVRWLSLDSHTLYIFCVIFRCCWLQVQYLRRKVTRSCQLHCALKSQKEKAPPKSESNELSTRKKTNTIYRKRTPSAQSSTETNMDLLNSAIMDSLQSKHRSPAALSIQESPINFECTLMHKEPQD
jgi:hypothetical protein